MVWAVNPVVPKPLLFTALEFKASEVVPLCTPAPNPVPTPTNRVPLLLDPAAMLVAEPVVVKFALVPLKPLLDSVSEYVALAGAVLARVNALLVPVPTWKLPRFTVCDVVAAARL